LFLFASSEPQIRHFLPSFEIAALPPEAAGLTGFVALLPGTLGKLAVAAESSAGTGLAAGAV
jgi:hypothetical protein